MTGSEPGLSELKTRHPEWAPWLAILEEILREIGDPRWDRLVPHAVIQRSKIPLLAEAAVELGGSAVAALFARLFQIAHRTGTPQMASLQRLAEVRPDAGALFKASLHQDLESINAVAAAYGADAKALQAIVAMAAVPFLQACNRRWAPRAIAADWIEGYCPVCGAWPALAEVRGIDRTRHFRCGRCGAEWLSQCLLCPFCGMTDHQELVSLVPENSASNRVIEACKRCLGYVKTFTRLQGSPPARVLIDDFESVELDIAALDQGYKRPAGNGYALNLIIL
jgi:FdhE protein